MKIVISGSISFYKEIVSLGEQLRGLGHEVHVPAPEADGRVAAFRKHFEKIEWADTMLVANFDKNGVEGYIGGSVLMEMAVAFYLQKPMYALNDMPELSYKDELKVMNPIVIRGDLSKVN
jgi:hypothetical protein